MPKWLAVLIFVFLVVTLLLTFFAYNKIEQDISTFPYGNLIIKDENISNVGVSLISYNEDVLNIEFTYQVYSFGGNSLYACYEFSYNYLPDVGVYNYFYEGPVDSYFKYSSNHSSGLIYELENSGEFSDTLVHVGDNLIGAFNFQIVKGTDAVFVGSSSLNPDSYIPPSIEYISMNFNFNSFSEQFKALSSFQTVFQPPPPSGYGWDFVLDLIIYDLWGGFVWLVQWVAVPVSLVGGVYIW